VKIRSVIPVARRRAFSIQTVRGSFDFPWSELDAAPSAGDPVVEVFPDPDLGREGFTYRLASGAERTVHVEHVRQFVRDPDHQRKELLYALTNEAIAALASSGRAKRSLARQLGTSLAQLARLLDPANTRKSLDQMIRLLAALGRSVELRVSEPAATGAASRATRRDGSVRKAPHRRVVGDRKPSDQASSPPVGRGRTLTLRSLTTTR
jgi:hypothetical protein